MSCRCDQEHVRMSVEATVQEARVALSFATAAPNLRIDTAVDATCDGQSAHSVTTKATHVLTDSSQSMPALHT